MNSIRFAMLPLLALMVLLTACAHMERVVKAPEVVLKEIRLDALSLQRQRFSVDLLVSNPNDFRMNIRELSYHLTLEGVDLTRGVFDQGLDLAAGASDQVTVAIETDLLQTGQGLLSWFRDPGDTMAYRVEGVVRPARVWMGEIPYRHSGEVDFRTAH
ncbi:LEA14-like dessication related protein [Natronospira proteinivora]|uniref:LEA14-like dessication related protein n=1 Tax=Natronospira proteinivora TaxID=1807133 RepID=A0ABT1G8Q6_9GAMM|nr:LEA type 2 family protein [Natronospira proteinivora]MCP1727700.1 LEA14-like dessication related protein [Natronospira proteinivora]